MSLSRPPASDHPFLPADTFKDDVIMITGAGTGIGKAMAEGFARLGGRIVIASRKDEHRASGVKAVEAAGGIGAEVHLDVRDAESVKRAFDEAEAKLGPVTVLVNNAAANFPCPAEELSANGWRAITQATLDGVFFCSTEFARRRIALERSGAILSIGAAYGWTGGPGMAASAAAKAGVMNLVQSLSVEWAPDDIRVNGLVPGQFPHGEQLEVLKQLPGRDNLGARVPAQRVGELHEFAWAACFLCSPFAAYITGNNLVIDGANWLRRGIRYPEFEPVRSWARSKR